MSEECPIPEFKKAIEDKVEGHHATLYGKEGIGGVVGCMKKKISRSFLMWCAIIMVSILGAIGGLAYRAYSEGNQQRQETVKVQINSMVRESELLYSKQKEHNELKGRTQKLETDMTYIKTSLKEIKQAIKELPDKLR